MSKKIERQRPGGSQLVPQVEPITVGNAPSPAKSQTTEVPNSGSAPVADGGETPPRYLQMARLDARIRPDQADTLAILRRRLSGQRTSKVERITDNTLIRVAVDLLLKCSDQLHGDTEEDLRNSVISLVRD